MRAIGKRAYLSTDARKQRQVVMLSIELNPLRAYQSWIPLEEHDATVYYVQWDKIRNRQVIGRGGECGPWEKNILASDALS